MLASADTIGSTGTAGCERTLQVRLGPSQHEHPDSDKHECEKGADVDQLAELGQRHQQGDHGDGEDSGRDVTRTGALDLGADRRNAGGSSLSRLMAKKTRVWPSSRIMTTVVSPISAPTSTITAIDRCPRIETQRPAGRRP